MVSPDDLKIKKTSLQKMLDNFIKTKEEEDYCDYCKNEETFESKTMLSKLPEIIIVICERFQEKNGRFFKVEYIVDYPEMIDLAQYMFNFSKIEIYLL